MKELMRPRVARLHSDHEFRGRHEVYLFAETSNHSAHKLGLIEQGRDQQCSYRPELCAIGVQCLAERERLLLHARSDRIPVGRDVSGGEGDL
jgi:hypothetical protein